MGGPHAQSASNWGTASLCPSHRSCSEGLLGDEDIKTTMIYTHVLNRGGRGVRSPIDGM